MTRRLLAVLFGAAVLLLAVVGPAQAQETDPASPVTVLPDDETPTTVAPTTAPVIEVKDDTISLPRTGGELGGAAVAGAALTAVGVALAVGARKRRTSLDVA